MTESDLGQKHREFMAQAAGKASLRATFDFPLAGDTSPRSDRLSTGPNLPGLIGIPGTAALSSTYQYLEFAKTFRANRDLFAISVPGFVAGEPLPATLDVAVAAQATAVRACMNEQPAVLIGISSGGTLAYGVASHLETIGLPVAAVVLLDTYPFRSAAYDDDHMYAVYGRMFEEKALRRYLTDTRVSAMAWYAKLFLDWDPPAINAPTLLVQPADPMPDMDADGRWRSDWSRPHETLEVNGDHWTMMIEHSGSTAAAVEEWISQLPAAGNTHDQEGAADHA